MRLWLFARFFFSQQSANLRDTQKGSLMNGDWTGQQVGNYAVLQLLEQGTAIDRYLGSDMSSQKQVTLHLLAAPTDEAGLFRFSRNVPILKRLVHPFISLLLDAGVEGMTPFLVLDDLPTSRQSHQFPLPLPTVVRYVAQLAEAFDSAHSKGIWHTYTTPETILIGSQGEALLGGFGVRLLESSQHMHSQTSWASLVSPAYLSPEQIGGDFQGPSADEYALAVVVYEWLCGVPPFQGSTPVAIALQHLQAPPPPLQEKMPIISQALEQVMGKALAKLPAERFSSIKSFSTALIEGIQKTLHGPTLPM